MLRLLRDYDHVSELYAPRIVSSRAQGAKDDGAKATLAMRLKEQKVITVVLDAEYRVEIGTRRRSRIQLFPEHSHLASRQPRIGTRTPGRPEGDDDGFLWRLNSYWSFAGTGEGLAIECEAVSLTRTFRWASAGC